MFLGSLFNIFGEKVYRTVVPRNVRLAEAPSHGLPVMMYDRGSRGSLAYLALASEMQKRPRHQRMIGKMVGAEQECASGCSSQYRQWKLNE